MNQRLGAFIFSRPGIGPRCYRPLSALIVPGYRIRVSQVRKSAEVAYRDASSLPKLLPANWPKAVLDLPVGQLQLLEVRGLRLVPASAIEYFARVICLPAVPGTLIGLTPTLALLKRDSRPRRRKMPGYLSNAPGKVHVMPRKLLSALTNDCRNVR
jgi:hypothetical protein